MSSKNAPQLSFEEIWERIKNKTDIKTISNLAKILEIKQPSVSSQKKKGTFPINWAYWISEKYNLSLKWILKGEESEENQFVIKDQDAHNNIFKSSENHKIMEKTRFDDAWERIKSRTDIKKISQLAKIIGKTQQNISAKKIKGDEFPIEWAYWVSEKYGLSLNWILKGEESEENQFVNNEPIHNMPPLNFGEVWERIKSRTKIKTMGNLAELLGIRQQSISAQKKRGTFPMEWVYVVASQYALSLDWLVSGNEQKKIVQINEYILMLNQWLHETVNEDQRKEFWFQCTIEKAFPEFKEWKDKKNYPERNRKMDEELV